MPDEFSAGWYARAASRWGHYAPEMLMAAVVAVIVLGLRPIESTGLGMTVAGAVLCLVLGAWVLLRRHDRSLCELCLATLPLNAAEQAAKYRLRLWVTHSAAQPRLVLAYLVVLVGSSLLPGPVGRLVWALVQTSLIYLVVSYTTHRRLQPWCPWCRGGDDGDDHDPATPDPPPGKRRQLV